MQIQKLMLTVKELVKLKTILKQTQVPFTQITQQKLDMLREVLLTAKVIIKVQEFLIRVV
jgi:hypothetical protein